MARQNHTGAYLYGIAALALSYIAWHTTHSLSDQIAETPRFIVILLAILLSLLIVYIQYKKIYGKTGRIARINQLRRRREETSDAFDRRKTISALWSLCRSFLLMILWGILSWAAASLLRVWLPAIPSDIVDYVMTFIAYGAAISLWTLVDQFLQ